MVAALLALLSLAGAIGIGMLSREASAWLPVLAQTVAAWGAKRFRDPLLRERYSEEWKGHVAEIPGPIAAFLHAISMAASVRSIEQNYASQIKSSDVDARFTELGQLVRDFADAFTGALIARGLSVEDVARATKIPVRDLKALLRGDLNRVRIGYDHIFYYMQADLTTMIGSDLPEVMERYADLLRKSGGLPPSPPPSVTERIFGAWCVVAGHRVTYRYIHSRPDFPFHWWYRRCQRCGSTSTMHAEPCSGTKVRSKRDFDAPLSERFACETDYEFRSRTLDEPVRQWGVGEQIKLSADRLKELDSYSKKGSN